MRSGDTLELSRLLQDTTSVPNAVQNDDYRLMNLTHTLSDKDSTVVVHRLDRLHAQYAGEKLVLKAGRQSVSWGNGLMYNPVDFFNPFDPAAVDKEYKTGDDMLYGQYLQDSGNDLQFVSVWRRDADGNTGHEVNTNALKYHAFIDELEVDTLLARHYEDNIASVGAITSWGGAIVRGDILLTHTEFDTYTSGVINLTYSWNWGGKNISGLVEYFHNGFGLDEKDYGELSTQSDLVVRLTRGELFTIGRDYMAGGLSIEMTPLIHFSPNVFLNLEDGSGLLQAVAQYDLHQDWQLLVAGNFPFGSSGTEFGGLPTGVDNLEFSQGPSLFAQLAFYF